MNGKDFANLLVTLRKHKKISQAQLAEVLNVTTSAISKWENGKNFPDITTFERIAEYYGVAYEDMHRPNETLKKIESNTYFYVNYCESLNEEDNSKENEVNENASCNFVLFRILSSANWKNKLFYGFAFLISIYIMCGWIIHEIRL